MVFRQRPQLLQGKPSAAAGLRYQNRHSRSRLRIRSPKWETG